MSKEPEAIDVVVDEAGALTFVWHDALAELVPAGYTCDIQRVSDVEPTPDGRWTADMEKAIERMTPEQRNALACAVGPITGNSSAAYTILAAGKAGALVLGPYATRAEALQAERDWLREHAGV